MRVHNGIRTADNVCVVDLRAGDLLLQFGFHPEIIAVQKGDIVSPCLHEANVAGTGNTEITGI